MMQCPVLAYIPITKVMGKPTLFFVLGLFILYTAYSTLNANYSAILLFIVIKDKNKKCTYVLIFPPL